MYVPIEIITAIASGVGIVASIGGLFAWGLRRLDRRFEAIDARFKEVDQRFGNVDEKFFGVSGELAALRLEMRDEFANVREEMREGFVGVRVEMRTSPQMPGKNPWPCGKKSAQKLRTCATK